MSARSEIQDQVVDVLSRNRRFWTAPYGVLPGMEKWGKGKMRTVTFGIARTLDATIYIQTPTRIVVEAQGPAARLLRTEYGSVEELLADLDKGAES